ncbi:MAG: hypothetical protein ACRD2L_13940 [Terriglobia bacterium]
MAATAAIVAGVLGAGGSVAGGILSQPKEAKAKAFEGGGIDPATDPAIAEATFNALLNIGVLDPDVLLQSSPLNRTIQSFNRENIGIQDQFNFQRDTVAMYDTYRLLGGTPESLQQAMSSWKAGFATDKTGERVISEGIRSGEIDLFASDPLQFLALQTSKRTGFMPDVVLQRRGFGLSGRDPFGVYSAETRYQSSIGPRLEEASRSAEVARQTQLGIPVVRGSLLDQLKNQIGGAPGAIASVREQELARLNRQFDVQGQDVLKRANQLGFNPGRAIGELETNRVLSADLEALNRALALVGGQSNLLGQQIGQLAGIESPVTSNLLQTGSARVTGAPSGPAQFAPSVSNPLGAGIAQAVPAGLLSYNIANQLGSRGPATQPSLEQALAQFRREGYGDYGG